MKERIWAYFLQLGNNMWGDDWSKSSATDPFICHIGMPYSKEHLHTDREVWNEITNMLPECGFNTLVIDIGEGIQYEKRPELAVPGAWSKDEMRAEIKRLQSMGIEPIPKVNFSSTHDGWLKEYARMKGTHYYYEAVSDIIDEICELFPDAKYFHLGMDEEALSNSRSITIVRGKDLWKHDLRFYGDCVKRNGKRPWIWGDYYWDHQDSFEDIVPKDYIVSNWWYERLESDKDGNFVPRIEWTAYDKFSELGYDQIPGTSNIYCHQTMAQTVQYFKERDLINEHLLGFMTVPWKNTDQYGKYALMDAAHRAKYDKELFDRYVEEVEEK